MDRDELIARLQSLDCVMVEVCEPHPGNPSPNIIPISRADLLAALENRPARDWARAVAETMDEGDGFWRACSGCQESVDGCVSFDDYPYSEVFRCQPGGGCGECGGLGVIWDDTDYEEMARYMLATDTTPSRDEEGSVDREAIAEIRRVALAVDEARELGYAVQPLLIHLGHLTEKHLDAILALKTQPSRIREAGERMAGRMGGKFILHDAETQAVEGGERDAVERDEPDRNRNPYRSSSTIGPKPTTPERSMVLEEAARIAESEPRVWDPDAPDPQTRIAAKIRALSASSIEVEK